MVHLKIVKLTFNKITEGLGVKRDYTVAIKNFGLASKSGNLLGSFNFAQMHAFGIGVLRSCTTSLEVNITNLVT